MGDRWVSVLYPSSWFVVDPVTHKDQMLQDGRSRGQRPVSEFPRFSRFLCFSSFVVDPVAHRIKCSRMGGRGVSVLYPSSWFVVDPVAHKDQMLQDGGSMGQRPVSEFVVCSGSGDP